MVHLQLRKHVQVYMEVDTRPTTLNEEVGRVIAALTLREMGISGAAFGGRGGVPHCHDLG